MSAPPNPAARVNDLLRAIAPKLSIALSESIGGAISVEPTESRPISSNEMIALGAADSVCITFSLASLPQSAMLATVPGNDFAKVLAAAEFSETPMGIDELIESGKPYLEAIVHGFCLAASDLSGQPAAAGLSIKSELPTAPSASSHEDFHCLTWLASCEASESNIHLLIPESVIAALVPAEGSEEMELETVSGEVHSGAMVSDERLELLMDIPLEISVELGRVKMEVREVLGLTAGSIVEINKAAGEPVDVLVNGRPVARGEVVVIDENFGVRITEILSPRERLGKLREAS
jgi:flagellar motor switch protein FliN/FliY